MKIIDCFTFYNEIDLLKYRLKLLECVVDYVVVVESTHTHVGNDKILYFDEFKKASPLLDMTRIIHVVVDDFPYKAPDIQLSPNCFVGQQWINERFQRDCISRGLEQVPCLENDDIIIVSDLDEIPDPRTLQKIKNNEIEVTINHLEMAMYYYNLNTIHKNSWVLGFLCKYSELADKSYSLSRMRLNRVNTPNIINGGWHLSYFGDVAFIQNKLKEFGHVEYNNEYYTNEQHIKEKIDNFVSLFDKIGDNSNYTKQPILKNKYPPLYFRTFLSKYVLF